MRDILAALHGAYPRSNRAADDDAFGSGLYRASLRRFVGDDGAHIFSGGELPRDENAISPAPITGGATDCRTDRSRCLLEDHRDACLRKDVSSDHQVGFASVGAAPPAAQATSRRESLPWQNHGSSQGASRPTRCRSATCPDLQHPRRRRGTIRRLSWQATDRSGPTRCR